MALRPTGARWAVAHDDAGLATLVARLQAVQPTLMVLAATGGDQRAVVAALAATGLPVVVGIARQSRDGAKATGQLAQTDALNARALAHVAEAVHLTPGPCLTPRPTHAATVHAWRIRNKLPTSPSRSSRCRLMPSYDASHFDPPAPVARVTLRNPHSGVTVSDVVLLLDTGADVTMLPRMAIERLGVPLLAG
jgi:hypothetical protein